MLGTITPLTHSVTSKAYICIKETNEPVIQINFYANIAKVKATNHSK